MKLRWIPHTATSALHAAEAHWRGEALTDAKLADAVREPAATLAREIAAHGLPELPMWRNLAALAPTFENRRHLAKIAGLRAAGRPIEEAAVVAVAAAVTDLEQHVNSTFPDLLAELELRGKVLREQWEARGPGMLRRMQELLPPDVLVPGADVQLVQPAVGGDGKPHFVNNTTRIEAVLANPFPQLPETVRLAWLLAQLNLDMPMYSEAIRPARLPHVAAFAMLPVVLEAAHYVELVTFDRDLLPFAMEAWRMRMPADADGPELVANWWMTFQQAQPPFGIALKALDEMFG